MSVMRRVRLPSQESSSRIACCSSAGLPDRVVTAYQTAMPQETGPVLFDRRLLRARQQRAERQGAATFLLDRVAEEMAERLLAVVREFSYVSDIGTPGDAVRNALAGRGGQFAHVDLPD